MTASPQHRSQVISLPLFHGVEVAVSAPGSYEQPEPGAVEHDKTWRETDAAGHGHFHSGHTANPFPTLTQVYVCPVCADDECEGGTTDDCYLIYSYVCTTCGEPVTPGTKPAGPRWVDAPREVQINAVGAQPSGAVVRVSATVSGRELTSLEQAMTDRLITELFKLGNSGSIKFEATHEG